MRRLTWIVASLVVVGGCDAVSNLPRRMVQKVTHAPRPIGRDAHFELCVVSPTNTTGAEEAVDPVSGETIYLVMPPIISAADIATVQRADDSRNMPRLTLWPTPLGARKLSNVTAQVTGQKLAVVIDGTVVAVPQLHGLLSSAFQISSGSGELRDEWFESLTRN